MGELRGYSRDIEDGESGQRVKQIVCGGPLRFREGEREDPTTYRIEERADEAEQDETVCTEVFS